MKKQDFLLELGTEELPPKLLLKLSESLKNNIINELEQLNIINVLYRIVLMKKIIKNGSTL